jgi:hypothetical protein
MKKVWFVIWFLNSIVSVHGQVAEKLRQLGMENIQVVSSPEKTFVSFENTVFRSTYRGVGEGIRAALTGMNGGDLELVVLDNQVPQLHISISDSLISGYRTGAISLKEIFQHMRISTDSRMAMERLKESGEIENRSAGKVDIIVYPELFLENNKLYRLFSYYFNLSPAVELGLWKGGLLTAQVAIPASTNMTGQYGKIRPGIITLSQESYFASSWWARVLVGNLTNNRFGFHAETRWRSKDGRFEARGQLGATSQSIVTNKDDGWYISNEFRYNGALRGSMFVPRYNLRFDLQAARYIFSDYGIRGDMTRYFGECAIGFYGMLSTDGRMNAGFSFAVPLPGSKWSKNRGIRIRQADYFDMEYSMISGGKYFEENRGQGYRTRPDDNRSSHYFQPDYVRYFLVQDEMNK